MKKTSTALAGVFLIGGYGTAWAESPNVEKPMLHHAESAVTQPIKDVNLRKDKIPARLMAIQNAPYDLTGIEGCNSLNAEIDGLLRTAAHEASRGRHRMSAFVSWD